MPEPLISALVQAPFVLAMAYLVQRFLTHLNERDQEWRSFIERADETLAERLAELTEAVKELSMLVVAHDASVRGLTPEKTCHSDDLLRAIRGR